MKKYFERIIALIRTIDWKNRRTRGIALVGAILFLALIFVGSGNDNTVETPTPLRSVTLLDVSSRAQKELVSNTENKVREIVVRAETSGKVTKTLVAGTRVGTGDVIAELENSAQRAALLQAEGSLEAAEAGQEKTKKGLRSEQISNRETSLESAKNTTVTTLLSAYATVDSSVNDTADKMFYRTGIDAAPIFTVKTKNDSNENQIEQIRFELDAILARELSQGRSISTATDLIKELTLTEAEVRKVRNFTDMVLAALTDSIPTNIVSETDITSHRAAMTSARTSLTSTLTSLSTARTNLETAAKNLEEGLAYSQDTDLASASAGVKQAAGAYAAALSAYQKTIIRASTPGEITSCSVKTGDVISVGADVCRISTTSMGTNTSYILPLSSVKYTPAGAYVFVVQEDNTTKLVRVETGLVTANAITVTGLLGTENIVSDIRGLKEGEKVEIVNN